VINCQLAARCVQIWQAVNTGLTQLEADLRAFKPGTKPVGYSNVPAYFAADMFIQALKKVGPDITPEAVQQALAAQTWQIPGLAGPTEYPASTAVPTQWCQSVLQAAPDGAGYTTLEPFACSTKTYPIDPKITG
jgi:ABC-type branched-subunit amino acid transport system substrate-binding protein